MRVIAGKFKGKRLFSPEGRAVRPTTDRIKETLFNVLYSKGLAGAELVLDLFGGSGALGIEALSRGAEKVVFVDRDPASVKLISANLAHAGAKRDEYEVYTADFALALKKLQGRKFDLIFADPPYAAGLERSIVEEITTRAVLNKGGMLVIECSELVTFDPAPLVSDRRKCGKTALNFLSFPKEVTQDE